MSSPWQAVGSSVMTAIGFLGVWALTSWLDGLGTPRVALAGIWIACSSILVVVWVRHEDRAKLRQKVSDRFRAYTVTAFGVIGSLGTAFVAVVMWASQQTPPVLPEKPDVALRFVGTAPSLVIENRSGVLAREIKWWAVVFNLDSLDMEPLPIPAQTFDWMRPHSASAPQSLFGLPKVAGRVKQGDRLVGYVSAVCPECVGTRAYILSARYGIGGWFADLPEQKGILPGKLTPGRVAAFEQAIHNLIPASARVQIPPR